MSEQTAVNGNTDRYDVVVVGAGIVGLATTRELQRRYSDLRVAVVEAEAAVSQHQSGHNSGVLHSGLYYRPGSQKAILCRRGKAAMQSFCDEHEIPWDRCGKVVVATNEAEVSRLEAISARATENGVEWKRIDTDQLRELEPKAAGVAALHVPDAGIVNYRTVCETLARRIRDDGGEVRLGFGVQKIESRESSVALTSRSGATVQCGRMINCGGLHSDRVAKLAGAEIQTQIVPFRGEYYELQSTSESLCRNLIYPVPDPAFPFLGVHFTRMIDGGVECGPNAVLALARNGYGWSNVNLRDLAETMRYKGFRRLATKHWRMGCGEVHRSLSKQAFVKALQKLIPSLTDADLKPGRAGVRAQAVAADGSLVDDFQFAESRGAVHVLNAPSPAATASLAIAEVVVDRFANSD